MRDEVKKDTSVYSFGKIAQSKYTKQHPYVDDRGIWMPIQEYVSGTTASYYRMVMSKEMFVEAYNKWIKDVH